MGCLLMLIHLYNNNKNKKIQNISSKKKIRIVERRGASILDSRIRNTSAHSQIFPTQCFKTPSFYG